jgi:hypothetical protein
MDQTLLPDLFCALDMAVIERMPDQHFRALAPHPAWFAAVVGAGLDMSIGSLEGALPFLVHFLKEADVFWRESNRSPAAHLRVVLMALPDDETPSPEAQAARLRQLREAATLDSGPFIATVGGEDLMVHARALTVAGRMLLVIERMAGAADTRPMLQKAREHALDREQLGRQLDTIHAPVAAIDKHLAELQATALEPAQQQLIARIAEAHARLKDVTSSRPEPVPRSRRSTTKR